MRQRIVKISRYFELAGRNGIGTRFLQWAGNGFYFGYRTVVANQDKCLTRFDSAQIGMRVTFDVMNFNRCHKWIISSWTR